MSEEELTERCKVVRSRHVLYWVCDIYGFGIVIRRYGFYPKWWPLNIYVSHGVSIAANPAPHELANIAPVMFYFSQRLVGAFRKASSKPCYCLISPNVYFRRSKKIERDPNAKGTLAFLAHTTPMIEDKMNLMEYIRQLKELPEKYQPVSICLHYHDVNKGVHRIFYKEGFHVVTVGSPFCESFIEYFYEMIRQYRYTTSNEIGSYSFYSVEMGIPFFLYGTEPDLYNHGDPNIEAGKYDSYKRTNQYKKVRFLFGNRTDEVTPEQTKFVEEELGVYHSVSRIKMAFILYVSYLMLKYEKVRALIYKALTFIKRHRKPA